MSEPQRRVLLTGATGYIAGQLLPVLRDRYDLRAIDVRTTDRDGAPVAGVEVIDLLDAGADAAAALFAGVDTVVHCGYIRPRPEHVYEDERRNVDLMQRVYDLALRHDVQRVVACSTNQASKWYEQPWYRGQIDRLSPSDYPRSESFYGWAKAAYESLGHVYACGALGRALEVVHIRIVAPRPIDAAGFAGKPAHLYARDIAGFVSERDLQQLFTRSIDARNIDDEFGVPFQIFYGVSNNARTFWSITNARQVVGYAPQDDSEVLFQDDIARLLHGVDA